MNFEANNSTEQITCNHKSCVKTENICSENNLCIMHCDSINHGHCITHNCAEFLNLCEDKCVKHCVSENHLHCSSSLCDKKLNFCNESSLCVEHCESEEHGHCSFYSCSSFSNICKDGNGFCISHCKSQGHGHCFIFTCSKQNICNADSLCENHCSDSRKKCNHCNEFGCGSRDITCPTKTNKKIHFYETCSIKCSYHCREKNHGHCIEFCTKTENLSKNNLCSDHINNRFHKEDNFLCMHESCEESMNICRETGLCKKHCTVPKHSHCTFDLCDTGVNLCSNHNDLCIRHCNSINPFFCKHCSDDNCAETVNLETINHIDEEILLCPKHIDLFCTNKPCFKPNEICENTNMCFKHCFCTEDVHCSEINCNKTENIVEYCMVCQDCFILTY